MYKLSAILFCSLLAVFFLLTVVLPPDERAVITENRNMAEFPALSAGSLNDGSFVRGIEDYLSDRTALRSYLIEASRGVTELYGIKSSGPSVVVISEETEAPTAKPSEPPSETPSVKPSQTTALPASSSPSETTAQSEVIVPSESAPPSETSPQTEPPVPSETTSPAGDIIPPRKVGSLLVFDDNLMEIFRKKEAVQSKYAKTINGYASLASDNLRVFSILVPTQIEFQKDEYKSVSDSEKDAIDMVYSLYVPEIQSVSAYEKLKAHADEYIYFRSDHHWTQLGAYYGYEAFCEAAGFDTVPLSQFNKKEAPGFLGYLYNMKPGAGLEKNPDTVYYYEPKNEITLSHKVLFPIYADEKRKYSIFMGGDRDYYVVETDIEDGGTAIIVKDSYANAFAPWLISHYKRIIMVDPRTYEGSIKNLAAKYDKVDLIFLNYVFTTTFDDFIDRIAVIK